MSEPTTTPSKKVRVKLTCEERLLLCSLLTNARNRDPDIARRVDRIRKTLGIGAPDPRTGVERKTFEPLDAGERAAVKFEVVEIKDPKTGEVIVHQPKLDVSKDKPAEFRLKRTDHEHICKFLDDVPEGLGQPSGYQWLGLLDAFDIGELDDETDDDEETEDTGDKEPAGEAA